MSGHIYEGFLVNQTFWARKTHLSSGSFEVRRWTSGSHRLVTAYITGKEKRNLCSLPAWPCSQFTDIQAYFFRIVTYIQNKPRYTALRIEQLLYTQTFHWGTAIVVLTETKLLRHSDKFSLYIYIYICIYVYIKTLTIRWLSVNFQWDGGLRIYYPTRIKIMKEILLLRKAIFFCDYMYMYMCMHIHKYIHMHTYMCKDICTCAYMCMYTFT